ncbi:RNA-binding protein 4B-like isoform X2 [Ciconia boyciana]|uniref:RNA-binding protein 4B-like isoform X2 n=1 Tax=Ciconia boyciana TaxID=52775 RepID=UPI003BA243B2
MVKLFIGNLPREATEQEIRSLFEQYGKVLECDIIKNYGFVHIEDKTAAEDAIRNLHHHKLHGVCINVEASKNKSKASTKLHVGNISPACTNLELRAKFEEYGPVIECDIVKDYAFVHMERAEDAVEAIRGLDNTEFQGGDAAAEHRGPPGTRRHPGAPPGRHRVRSDVPRAAAAVTPRSLPRHRGRGPLPLAGAGAVATVAAASPSVPPSVRLSFPAGGVPRAAPAPLSPLCSLPGPAASDGAHAPRRLRPPFVRSFPSLAPCTPLGPYCPLP